MGRQSSREAQQPPSRGCDASWWHRKRHSSQRLNLTSIFPFSLRLFSLSLRGSGRFCGGTLHAASQRSAGRAPRRSIDACVRAATNHQTGTSRRARAASQVRPPALPHLMLPWMLQRVRWLHGKLCGRWSKLSAWSRRRSRLHVVGLARASPTWSVVSSAGGCGARGRLHGPPAPTPRGSREVHRHTCADRHPGRCLAIDRGH